MSVSSRHGRTLSSPPSTTSYSNAFTVTQQRPNVVSRLAIEGKSKKGWDGASIKMYMKISLPLDSITPGSTIPLFPEENLKILHSEVHPLDNNSAPYNFSTTANPLLHRAARALNLPARLPVSYVSGVDSGSSTSVAPLDSRYTGRVVVSDYNVSYVLPKDFPRKEANNRTRRGTIVAHFMAAVDLWIPFLTHPPLAPFLISIPVPRCLSNHIKMSIFPRGPMASSTASLSSADEGVGWDLTADPVVTRQSARLSRSHSYTDFADDESSDASTSPGFPDGCGMQGTFPSTERIRLRWAAPAKPGESPQTADGRHRAEIKEVKGDMTCEVVGKRMGKHGGSEALMMKLEYNATCKGLCYPGVATLLGMDIGLDAGDCDVSWAPDGLSKWTVTGGPGFTGIAYQNTPTASTQPPSTETPPVDVLPSSPDRGQLNRSSPILTRRDSAMSTITSASLLHAPLPGNVDDYSFEASPLSTPASSVPSLGPDSSPERKHRSRGRAQSRSVVGRHTDTDTDPEPDTHPPNVPMTVQLNMNGLLPPSKAPFTFRISGTVLVTPRGPPQTPSRRASSRQRRSPADDDPVADPVAVPMFHVFHKEREVLSMIVRNSAEGANLEVHSTNGDFRGGKTLREGDQAACAEGARVALRSFPLTTSPVASGSREPSMDSGDTPQTHPQIQSGMRSYLASSSMRNMSMVSSAKPPFRDGPLMIPSVTVIVTPLLNPDTPLHSDYAVQISLPAPSDADSEWLEFGLAQPGPAGASSSSGNANSPKTVPAASSPHVHIASASVEGVPVRFQTNESGKPPGSLGLSVAVEEGSAKTWLTWVSIHVGQIGGGKVEVIYIVKGQDVAEKKSHSKKGKQKEQDSVPFEILLPSFALPVGRLEVNVQLHADFEVCAMSSNLVQQQSPSQVRRLLQFSMEEFHRPRLHISIAPHRLSRSTALPILTPWTLLVPLILLGWIVYLYLNLRITSAELHEMRTSMPQRPVEVYAGYPHQDPETVTVTTTIMSEKCREGLHTVSPPLDAAITPSSASDFSALSAQSSSTTLIPTLTVISVVPPSTPITPAAPGEPHGALPVSVLPSPWTLHFDIAALKMPRVKKTARAAMDTLLEGLETVWYLFRKVLHYPLDPP